MVGIYCILNVFNDKIYIGSSNNVEKRWKRHKNTLVSGKHHNIYLQRSYEKYGEGCFTYFVIEELENVADLFTREEYWIEELQPEYNIGSVGGGDTFTNHPEKESIRKVHTNNLNLLREQGKVPKTPSGCDNPNWKGGISGHDTCRCGKTKTAKAKLCRDCSNSSRIGENNSFFGKHHSEETKAKISACNKGKKNLTSRKPLMAENKMFESCAAAARHFEITAGAVTYRINSTNFPEWYLL